MNMYAVAIIDGSLLSFGTGSYTYLENATYWSRRIGGRVMPKSKTKCDLEIYKMVVKKNEKGNS